MIKIQIISCRTKLSWNPKTWVSVLIRLFSGKWNHSAFLVTIKDLKFIAESDPKHKGVGIVPFTESWAKGKYIHLWTSLYKFSYTEMYSSIISHVGIKYDYKGTLVSQYWYRVRLFFTNILGLKPPKWTGHSKAFAKDFFYCSEFVGFIWNKELPVQFQDWHKMSPSDIERECELFMNLTFKGNATKLLENEI